MNRCAICDCTDQDNPSAGITLIDVDVTHHFDDGFPTFIREARCLSCHGIVQENIEDLSLGDEDFSFAEK